MAVAIGDILTPAMGVALSPFPVVAVILMLLSEQGRNKGLCFMLGDSPPYIRPRSRK
jgi:hypothetical protein